MNYLNEIWRDIKGYEGLYKVSNEGNIKSIRSNKLLSLETNKAGYKNICEIGKERIRRAGEKVKQESGKGELDVGFKVLKLDSSNIKTWDADFENLQESL